MKIQPEHLAQLKGRVNRFLDANPSVDTKQALESTRKRWNIYWAVGGFSNAKEYQYLDDNNIDTAIKAALRDYRRS